MQWRQKGCWVMPNLKVTPFLMFEGKAEEAMTFYTSVIPDSRIIKVDKYGPEGPGAEGTVMSALFAVGDLTVMCTDSTVNHPFTFTPSFSFFVTCRSQEEIERLAKVLSETGNIFMPLNNYGFSRQFAWVGDRFGVSWQLNLE
jgi:predicted 3-demethylubiquinone-9 3-methyltransferase (glyoxalase superfamily)